MGTIADSLRSAPMATVYPWYVSCRTLEKILPVHGRVGHPLVIYVHLSSGVEGMYLIFVWDLLVHMIICQFVSPF